jgi:ABC-type nitrate/sulfonate/bicarbonate transport system substrate-binding protein
MNHRFVTTLILALFVFGPLPASAQLKKVRLSMPTVAITEVPFKIAQAKGFYREEGLDVEMIVIRGALGVTALLGGSVDYTTASGSIIAAAIRGIGVKLLLLIESKPGFDLVSDSAVRSFDRSCRNLWS